MEREYHQAFGRLCRDTAVIIANPALTMIAQFLDGFRERFVTEDSVMPVLVDMDAMSIGDSDAETNSSNNENNEDPSTNIYPIFSDADEFTI